ncbi:hypothetical protein Ahy_A03g015584 [Arachis hypogaea]|uniref:Tyrosine specific protein phosphatases domain-containing protein n=1 Tax=Arachis hypogaea TaxID=3818 RepID=A0A445E0V1_ARAHY|nr:hypothetical protein Ahy_A03g015584 [Arachis hypogaea]
MNYTLITDNLIMGSQPQKPEDINHLKKEEVSSLEWAILEEKRRVYVHCTARLGRAPGVTIAYLFWFYDMNPCCKTQLTLGNDHLQSTDNLWHVSHSQRLYYIESGGGNDFVSL